MGQIAVIGSGIAGLGAARVLARGGMRVELFEADPRPGGHSNTLTVRQGGRDVAVDTGFIIYNHRTYPRLLRLFEELQVPSQATDMSFSCACSACQVEWGSAGLDTLFAQRRNLLRLEHHLMLGGILRFFRAAQRDLVEEGALGSLSLGAWAEARRIPKVVLRHFLVPMGAAIWSTPSEQMLDFPAQSFLRFLSNHGLLGLTTAPPWRTVIGGSRVYVDRLIAAIGAPVHLSTPVRSVRRGQGAVLLEVGGREPRQLRFDQVLIATHSDTALQLLADPTDAERRLLGAIRYTDNETILHGDDRFMPAERRAWASWNHRSRDCRGPSGAVEVTYWMNRLQGLPGPPLFVTLNPTRPIDPGRIHARLSYAHPRFDLGAMAAQRELSSLQGPRTFFAGAWQGYGFHEDGLRSGEEAAAAALAAARAGGAAS